MRFSVAHAGVLKRECHARPLIEDGRDTVGQGQICHYAIGTLSLARPAKTTEQPGNSANIWPELSVAWAYQVP